MFVPNFWTIRDPISLLRESWELVTQCWAEMSTTLKSLADDGADLLFTGAVFQQPAANVAEYYDIPLATLHYFPMRVNGHLLPILPSPLIRSRNDGDEWLYWRLRRGRRRTTA